MIPIRDNIPYRTFPLMNYTVIALCTIAFFMQIADESDGRSELVEQYGMIPVVVEHPNQTVILREQDPLTGTVTERKLTPAVNPWLTLVTCIFLHGGWLHFLGNMWFLHIFGDNVEDRVGHVGYALFYLFCGAAASAAHLLTNSDSPIPTIGASGAIAGVMGAYLLLYPDSKVTAIVPIFLFVPIVVLPAPVFLGIWFILQFLQGAASITSTETTNVAWWAHVGGFFVGAVIALFLRGVGETAPPVEHRRTGTYHVGLYRPFR